MEPFRHVTVAPFLSADRIQGDILNISCYFKQQVVGFEIQ